MKELSRRDFLKLIGEGVKVAAIAPFLPNLGSQVELLREGINPIITELGDRDMFKGEGTPDDGSNGFRASYVSEDGKVILGGTEMGKYHLSNDFGKCFSNKNYPIINREFDYPGTPRDIVRLGNTKLIIVNDYNIDLLTKNGEKEYFSENIFPIKGEARTIQTAVCLPNGKIISGGNSLVGGIFTTTEKQVLDTIKYNQFNPTQKQEFYWENKYEYGNPRTSLIRSIYFDKIKNFVYIGGWSTPDNNSPKGMGVLCLDATTLKKVAHPYNFKDDLGDMPVNTINIIHYGNTEIMVQGMERSGIFEKRGYQKHGNTNFLKIWVNGELLSDEIVNCSRLAKYGNGWDIVSCGPGGTETIEINGKKYLAVCMFAGGICIGELDDVVAGRQINWQRISFAPTGQTGFNSFRAKTITNPETKKQELIVSRLSWKGGGPQRFARISF